VKLYLVSSNGAEFLSSFDFSKIRDGNMDVRLTPQKYFCSLLDFLPGRDIETGI